MRRPTRLLATLCTLLYLTVVGALPVLHAWTETPHETPRAHVHAEDAECAPPHDALHCPTCKVGGEKLALSTAASSLLTDAPRYTPSLLPLRQAAPDASPVRQPGSRAPPLA